MTHTYWQRAVTAGALAGGIFWALAGSAIVASDGAPAAVIAIVVAATLLIVGGSAAYRLAESPARRCVAVGAILAPLSGAVTLLTFGIGALVIGVLR